MSRINDIIQASLEQKPLDVMSAVDDIMREKIRDQVDSHKEDFARSFMNDSDFVEDEDLEEELSEEVLEENKQHMQTARDFHRGSGSALHHFGEMGCFADPDHRQQAQDECAENIEHCKNNQVDPDDYNRLVALGSYLENAPVSSRHPDAYNREDPTGTIGGGDHDAHETVDSFHEENELDENEVLESSPERKREFLQNVAREVKMVKAAPNMYWNSHFHPKDQEKAKEGFQRRVNLANKVYKRLRHQT